MPPQACLSCVNHIIPLFIPRAWTDALGRRAPDLAATATRRPRVLVSNHYPVRIVVQHRVGGTPGNEHRMPGTEHHAHTSRVEWQRAYSLLRRGPHASRTGEGNARPKKSQHSLRSRPFSWATGRAAPPVRSGCLIRTNGVAKTSGFPASLIHTGIPRGRSSGRDSWRSRMKG